jgi:hypothetical protein
VERIPWGAAMRGTQLSLRNSPDGVVGHRSNAVGPSHGRDPWFGAADYALSSTGTLIYLTGGVQTALRLVNVDMAGKVEPLVTQERGFEDLSVSPDGRRIVATVVENGGTDLWIYDRERDALTRPDTVLVRDAIDLSRSESEPFLFNHAMRSWLFGVLLSESAERAPDAELLAVATILHDLGLTDRYTAENRFEVDGANAARSFLKGRGISTQQMQVVWDAIALHTTRSIALHKEPEVVMTHSGITVDVLGAGLDRIPQDKRGAILAEFPRLALKNGLKDCLCNIARRKPESTFDNIVRDFGVRYVEGYTSPNFADVVANAPFSE